MSTDTKEKVAEAVANKDQPADPVAEMMKFTGMPKGVRFYGPFETPPGENVGTPHGTFGIGKHEVMWFVEGKATLQKNGQEIPTMVPVRVKLPRDLARALIGTVNG